MYLGYAVKPAPAPRPVTRIGKFPLPGKNPPTIWRVGNQPQLLASHNQELGGFFDFITKPLSQIIKNPIKSIMMLPANIVTGFGLTKKLGIKPLTELSKKIETGFKNPLSVAPIAAGVATGNPAGLIMAAGAAQQMAVQPSEPQAPPYAEGPTYYMEQDAGSAPAPGAPAPTWIAGVPNGAVVTAGVGLLTVLASLKK